LTGPTHSNGTLAKEDFIEKVCKLFEDRVKGFSVSM